MCLPGSYGLFLLLKFMRKYIVSHIARKLSKCMIEKMLSNECIAHLHHCMSKHFKSGYCLDYKLFAFSLKLKFDWTSCVFFFPLFNIAALLEGPSSWANIKSWAITTGFMTLYMRKDAKRFTWSFNPKAVWTTFKDLTVPQRRQTHKLPTLV